MQFDFFGQWRRRPRTSQPASLTVGADTVPLQLIRHQRAKRYVLRVRRDGSVRVTIPRGGSIAYALQFAGKHSEWIARQRQQRQADARPHAWTHGTKILFRGDWVILTAQVEGEVQVIRFADQAVTVPLAAADWRPAMENHLWSLAGKELPARTFQLAGHHHLELQRVVVRNQRSRWGSCSRKRTISLNWRLIQAPLAVRDYLILHELMHLREMNHSRRFWRLVEGACPGYQSAEAWLNAHAFLLR